MDNLKISLGKAKINLNSGVIQEAYDLSQKEFYDKYGNWSDDKAHTTTGNLMRAIKNNEQLNK